MDFKPLSSLLVVFALTLATPTLSFADSFEFYEDVDPPKRPIGGIFTQVTDKYGPLSVQVGSFDAEADHQPWSSWWYPLREDTLFNNNGPFGESTLSRYDRLFESLYQYSPNSVAFERDYIYDPESIGWAGLCNAWAMASIMEKEPTRTIGIRGINFRVQDLKALLIKKYEFTSGFEHFGERYEGTWENTNYEDTYPEQFHRFIQAELFDKNAPFIMDHDAGIQVWNVPVYKAKTKIIRDENDEEVVHVKTWLYTASPHIEDKNYVGTDSVIKTYTYDLYGSWNGDVFNVEFGLWTESSRGDHPDYLIPRPDRSKLKFRSLNEKINTEVVDYILQRAD